MAKCPMCHKKWYCNGQDMDCELNECPICRCPECRELWGVPARDEKKGAEEAPLQTL